MLIPNFCAGRTLFFMCGMLNIPYFRNMNDDFGILPIPKLDSAQGDYYHMVTIHGAFALGIPKDNEILEDTGIILESLAEESYKYIIPAYYDASLKNKFLSDNESIEMLDLIFKSRTYELGTIYNWGGLFQMYLDLSQKHTRDFASEYSKREAKAIVAMEKTIDSLKT